jgi:ribosome assembly protein YihI (activator of Der GTPase)
MSQAKAKARKASPKSKGEAARAEKSGKAKIVDFRGLKLKFPPKLPLSVALRSRQMQKEAKTDEAGASIGVLELLVGQEQFEAIIEKCDADGLNMDDDLDVIVDLIEDVMGALGVGEGES